MDSPDPIGAEEAESQLRYVRRAIGAPSEELRREALADGILAFGMRFVSSLGYLAEQDKAEHGDDDVFQPLADEASELFTTWLGGTALTDRADEDERRASVVAELAERAPGLGALAAESILALPEGHPGRDLERARALVERYLEANEDPSETELRAVVVLLEIGPADDAELEELLARGAALEPASDPEMVRRFRVRAAGECLVRAVNARDEDEDTDAQHAWATRGLDLVESFEPTAALLSLLGALFSVADDEARAADTFASAVQDPDANEELRLSAAMFEARFRSNLAQHDRVVELLAPRLAAHEERYLTAVAPEAIESAGSSLGDAVINLAFSLAWLGRWPEALRVLDRGRSLRARYRAALRRSDAGARLLSLERELYAYERGVTGEAPDAPDPTEDRFGQSVTPATRLLEAYRRLRPKLPEATVDSPAVADIAGVLAADEAAVLFGVTSTEVLRAAVLPGDDEAPALSLVEPFAAERWLEALAGSERESWLTGIEAGAPRETLSAALVELLEVADAALGDLPAELARRDVRRLVVVPHRWLHLVPWWAVPALSGFDVVQTSPSAAELVAARRAAAPPLVGHAVVVANPTGDLRASAAEAAAVGRRLVGLGLESTCLEGPAATEEAVLGAMLEHPGILHFCGHGRSDLVRPDRSALLLHPHVDLAAGDPFAAWQSAVEAWDEHDGTREGVVPGVGLLVEEEVAAGTIERRLEHGPTGTLWGRYDGERLIRLAELWTAGDMLVTDTLDGCALAVLSACESGSGSLGVAKIDEAAGLAAAMQLAGAATVVATLWPVGDALGALFVDMLYAGLAPRAANGGDVDVAELVQSTRDDLRTLGRDAAVERIDVLRRSTSDPIARLTLEAFGAEVAGRNDTPFAHPYDWAPFFATGIGRLVVPARQPAPEAVA